MAKCKRCGKTTLRLLFKGGEYCPECEEEVRREAEKAAAEAAEAERKKQEEEAKKRTPSVSIPSRYDNYYKIYSYIKTPFSPSSDIDEITDKMIDDGVLEFAVTENGKLYYNDSFAGTVLERTDMINDWIKRGDPVRVWLMEHGQAETVALCFYRDEIKRNEWRETDVVKLTKYANAEAQDNISLFREGDILDCREDTFEEDSVCVDDIGYLPKKQAKRYCENGAALVILDHLDYDIDKEKDIPFVKIFW